MTMQEREYIARCGDSGGRRSSGKPCRSTRKLNAVNGRCPYHDPLRRPGAGGARTETAAVPGESQSNWPHARRREYAEQGMVIVERTLDRLRDALRSNLFLYETTAALEPLLVCISAQTHLSALLKDVREGRRMDNSEIDRLHHPTKPLPAEDGVRKGPARVRIA